MVTDTRLEALESYHRLISTTLADGKVEMKRNDASSAKALALVRWELMRHLRAYQLYKHTRIFDPIIVGRSEHAARAAIDLKAQCIELSDAYADHVKRWSLVGPTTAWQAYVEEAWAISERIEKHIAVERRKVAELLALAGSPTP